MDANRDADIRYRADRMVNIPKTAANVETNPLHNRVLCRNHADNKYCWRDSGAQVSICLHWQTGNRQMKRPNNAVVWYASPVARRLQKPIVAPEFGAPHR